MKKEKGFTLIELLVVISIIALLLSILMPSLGKAKYQAQRIICMTRIKDQHLTQQLYANDNNGKYHPHDDNSGEYSLTLGTPVEDSLFIAISDYIDNVDIMNCPILEQQAQTDPWFEMFDPEYLGFAANWKAYPTLDEMKANAGVTFQSVVSSYVWTANYRCNWPNPLDPSEPEFNFVDPVTGVSANEVSWPQKQSDASSRTAFIFHRISDIPGYFFDFAHKGAGFSDAPNGFVDFATGVDNPVGRGDGSVRVTKKSSMEPRAKTGAGIIYY